MFRLKVNGFTLVELLIVLAITCILLTLAYPSYNNYVLKSHRAEALATLARDQVTLERCYSQAFRYNGTCPGLATFPHNSARNYYRIALSNLSATSFTLTATPIGNQALDTMCSRMSIDHANQKIATNSAGVSQPVCWGM